MGVKPIHTFLVKKRTTFTWLVPVGLFIVAVFFGRRHIIEFVAGCLLSCLGEIIRIWAAGTIHKDDTIAEIGPYGIVRNPLYLGSMLIAVGVAMMSGLGPIAWLIILLLFLLFHISAILYEEQFLRQKFGAPYENYLRKVPRLVPVPGAWILSSTNPHFSWEQVKYNREPTTALITFFTVVLYGLLQFLGR
jgi:protein-S-isoprenylcysteine O-methyltransferase Ste14